MRIPIAKFNDLSLRRTQLMGVATLMILVCHASASHVLMPLWLGKLMDLGNYGVDIFLMLSGLGLYHSLLNRPVTSVGGGVIYCKRRGCRVLIPYWIIYLPYCIIFLLLGKYSFGDGLLCMSALEYWFFHRGAWFVSLILILYLLAPAVYLLMSGKYRWTWCILVVIITVLCKIDAGTPNSHNVLNNIQFAFSRVPAFILGMAVRKACKEKKTVSVVWLVALAMVGLTLAMIFRLGYGTAWMIIPLMLYVIDVIFEKTRNLSWIESSMTFLGRISLESYLTNIALGSLLSALIPVYISSPMFYGKYLQYSIVIVAGLLLAQAINRLSVKWTEKLIHAS